MRLSVKVQSELVACEIKMRPRVSTNVKLSFALAISLPLALLVVLVFRGRDTTIDVTVSQSVIRKSDLCTPFPASSMATPGREATSIGRLSKKDVDGVEKFVFFVGYARSGSSIIGSMLDAHPNMIIANECDEFMTWLRTSKLKLDKSHFFNALYLCSRKSATSGGRSSDSKNRKGYSLSISSSWQGTFRKLRVIGNKQAGGTTSVYLTDPSLFVTKCEELADTLRMPIYMIHVVRNPFDMIATRLHYVSGMGTPHKLLVSNSPVPTQQYNMTIMTSRIDKVFKLSEAVMNISRLCKVKILHVHIEDLIRRPNNTIQSVCGALDLECSADYVQQCYNKTFKSVSRTRDLLVWSPSIRATVEKRMREFPFFKGYSLESSFREDG